LMGKDQTASTGTSATTSDENKEEVGADDEDETGTEDA